MTTAMRDGLMHIPDPAEERCTGGCNFCCEGSDRFWYQYLDRALGYTGDPHSVSEIRNQAVDDGAPNTIVAMIDGLLRTLRQCSCRGDICWCDTGADPWHKAYTQADLDYTNAYLMSIAAQKGDPDYELSFTERPGVGNVCWCGTALSIADTESLEAHYYCSPER
jgi:hypothetical protein